VPFGARLVMVCAAYDAMVEERPYRRGLPPQAACEELRRHVGTQFFSEVVDAFVRLHESGRLWEGFSREEFAQHVQRNDARRAA
jgi:HD-GYP domain-containing protein (c-di-GMP phosphodiesterase class II)